jgi:hypothetical protein
LIEAETDRTVRSALAVGDQEADAFANVFLLEPQSQEGVQKADG